MVNFFPSQRKTLALAAASARDSGQWKKAATLYTDYLNRYGLGQKTFGYGVQLGNCLKEAGAFDEALLAYDNALKIRPDNADLHLQRGHLFKLMGRHAEALFSYQKALSLDPANEYAKLEIERLGGLAFANVPTASDNGTIHTIWLDVSDFMIYITHNSSLSGIQRVVANLALYIRDFNIPGYRIVPVIPEYDRLRMLATQASLFIKLVEIFDDPVIDRGKLDAAMKEVYDARMEAQPDKNDILVIAGAFWIYPHYDLVLQLRQKGMRFGIFLHDLIQIRMPEYVAKDATDDFNKRLSDVLDLCDFILANSKYVAEDVAEYIKQYRNHSPLIEPVVLPTELKKNNQGSRITTKNITDMAKFDYVLMTSTIEVRKNHELLINVWEKLRSEFGEKTPVLVFVGKWGWQVEKLKEYIEEKGYIGDWLFIFNGISDNELSYLYRHCLFTVYPSFAEGFGLPIGESLAYGKACIASNVTSMPEVGGKFVRYIDPFDWEASYHVIRKPIADRADLAQWEDWIHQEFKPKTWEQFCREFYAAVVDHGNLLKDKPCYPNFQLPSEKVIYGGDHDILSMARRHLAMITFRATRVEGWHPPEHWGVWTSKRRATIVFLSDCVEGTEIDLFLKLHHAPTRNAEAFVIINAGCGEETIELSEHPSFFRFTGCVGPEGLVTIKLLARGRYPKTDARDIFIGWSGIAYCRHDASAARMRTLDNIVTAGLSLSAMHKSIADQSPKITAQPVD
ncbi:MAG: glycosyltransferase [Gluconacetobacter sp.]